MTVPPSPRDEQQDTPTTTDEAQPGSITIPIEKPGVPGQARRRRIAPRPPSSPIKKGLFLFILTLTGYALFGFFAAPLLITSLGSNYLEKKLDRPVTIGSAQVNPFRFHVVLKNGIIGGEKNNPEDKVDPLFSFGRLKIKLRPESLFTGQTPFKAIHGNSVFLHLVRNLDQSFNTQRFFQQRDQPGPFSVRTFIAQLKQSDLKLTDAKIIFEDRPSDTTHTISQISFRLPGETSPDDSPYFSAEINGSPINFGGFSGQRQTDEQRFEVHLKDISLTAYLNYLPAPLPTLLNKGKADLDITVTAQFGQNETFNLKLSGTGLARDLWVNDGRENHNKVESASFTFSSNLKEQNLVFHKLVLEKPEFHLSRTQDGQFYFPAKESFSGTPGQGGIALEALVIKNGRLIFIDQHVSGGFGATLDNVNLSIDKNADSQTSTYALNGVTNRKTRISSQGTLHPGTWQLEGLFILKELPLPSLNSYLSQADNMTLTSGVVEKLETSFTLAPLDPHKLTSLANTELSVTDLGLNAQGKEIITIPHLSLDASHYSHAEQVANLGRVQLQNGTFRLTPATPSPIPTFKSGQKQLLWKIDTLAITDSMVELRDFDFQNKPQRIGIPRLTGTNLSSDPQDKATLAVTTTLLKQGTWSGEGAVQFNPLRTSLQSNLKNIPLALIPEPLLHWVKPTLLGGTLSAQGQISLPAPSFTGSAAVKGLKLRFGDQHQLLTITQLKTAGTFSLSPATVQLKQVEMKELHTELSISRKKLLNRDDFFTPPRESGTGHTPSVSIESIAFTDSSFTLLDQTTEPPFSYTIAKTTGTIESINSTGTSETRLHLEGHGDDQTLFTVSGTSQFFTENFGADLTVTIQDFPVATLRPFIEPITGYGVENGMFDLNINYHEEGGVMASTTELDLRHLTLSNQEKGNPRFPDIVALLTDADHHIRLTLPINGDATDPYYTFQSAYGKKLGEFFLATMVAPFSALSACYPPIASPPNQLIFTPGTSIVAPDQQDKFLALQAIVKNRPLLRLTLTGYSGSQEDRAQLLREKQNAEQRKQAKAIEAAGTAVVENYGQELITPKQEALPPALPPKKTTLTKQELQDLARQRCEKIKSILMEEYGIADVILRIDPTPTVVPQSDSGVEGHRVECILSGQAP